MSPICCNFREAVDRQFTAERATKELDAYRKGQLEPTTRLLRDSIIDLELNEGLLLDVGGGIGALAFELLERGIGRVVIADASAAYVAAATDEAVRRGRTETATIVHGDLVELTNRLPEVNVVTLDRVVCCYPSFEPLLREAARHATRGLALSYPRDRWFVHAGAWLENTRRARHSGLRTFVHPPRQIQQVIESDGLELARRRTTAMWSVDVFVRNR